MEDDWTCGKGLAANAVLPEAMGTFFDALATVLDLHTRSLESLSFKAGDDGWRTTESCWQQ